MAVSIKRATLWRREVDNRPGMLASTLEPLAGAGVDLQVVMGYRYPGDRTRAAIEIYPVTGKKAGAAAASAGLSAAAMPTLLVEGDNRPGLGHTLAEALAAENINVDFIVAQTIGRRFSAVIGFDNDADSRKAARFIGRLIRRAAPVLRRARSKR
jgi:hypothetical protein